MPKQLKKQLTILLVEDEKEVSEIYSLALEQGHFRVLTARDGQTGLKLANSHKPDLILLDIILPKMDGFEMLTKLKGDRKTKGIPVVMLTNLGDAEDISRGKELGALAYLVKASYGPSQVVKKVKEVLGVRKNRKKSKT